jgi:CBS domain-containing protein
MKANDVMVTNVITVGLDASIEDVAHLLLTHRISAVPVVGQRGELVGIISEGDLIRRAELGTHPRRSWWLEMLAGRGKEALAAEYVKSHAGKVADLMTQEVITATPDTPLRDIAALLEKNRIKRVPIVANGKVVGIVSRANLVQALATLRKDVEPGSMTDSIVRDKILAQFNLEPWSKFSTLNVTVQNGTVELWGIVDTEAEKQAARVAAEMVAGADAVEDNVVVQRMVFGS